MNDPRTATLDADTIKRLVKDSCELGDDVEMIWQTDGSLLLVWPQTAAPPEAAGWRFVRT